jgi:hypothetical protein
MIISRKLTAALAGATIGTGTLLGVGLAVAPAAHAAPAVTSTTCTVASATATLTPGITTSPGKTHVVAPFTASQCKAVTGATSVKGTITLNATKLSCISGSAAGTFTAKTNNGKATSGTMTLAATSTPLQFTLKGKVTKGFLDGSTISGSFKATPVKGNCTATSKLTKATVKNLGSFKL